METILRHLNARSFLIAGGIVALIVLADRFQGYPRGWYINRLNAAERSASPPPATDIALDLNARESLQLRSLYRTVSAEIAAAQARGFDVARLQPIADQALKLDTPAYRRAAIESLNKLRLVVPQPVEGLRPAGAEDEASDNPPTPKSSTRRTRRK